ncbi:MAG: GxxExxY protein [Desulfotomaculaceae bacterium]
MEDNLLTEKVISCAFNVHNVLGTGFMEKVYENALKKELADKNLKVEQQVPIKVYYKQEVVGDYYADLLVENQIIVELKTVQTITREHEVQLVNYLTATGLNTGLLINFGSSVQVKRKFRKCLSK